MMELERRSFPLTEVEIRTASDGRTSFRGLAATFGDWSKDLGGFRERIDPGAFTRAINEGQDVPFLVNHNPDLFLARSGTGTVKLSATDRGLLVEADGLPDTQAARDLKALGSEVRSMSFGFKVPKGGDEWNWKASPAERALRDVNLGDVSVLTGATPAYNDTTAEIRALVDEHRDYTTAERVALAKAGKAMPIKNDKGEIVDGGYPIDNTTDLGRAIQAIGRAKDPAATKTYIIGRAKALGASGQIPDGWRSLEDDEELRAALEVIEHRLGAVLSSQSKQHVTNALDSLSQAQGHLENLMAQSGDSPTGNPNDMDGMIEEQASHAARGRVLALAAIRIARRADTEHEKAEREPATT